MIHVVCDCVDALEEIVEVERDRDFGDRVIQRAVIDQEARCAAAEVAGHGVEAEAHHAGHVEPVLRVGDQIVPADRAGLQREVAGRRRYAAGWRAGRTAGTAQTELSGAVAIQEIGLELAVSNDDVAARYWRVYLISMTL